MSGANRRAILCGLAALSASAVPFATQAADDAELLRLGRLFESAWEREAARWRAFSAQRGAEADDQALWDAAENAADATQAIVREIERHQAMSLAGVLVKMRACSWCHGGEPFDGTFLPHAPFPTTDLRLAEGVLRDLMAIDGRSVPL